MVASKSFAGYIENRRARLLARGVAHENVQPVELFYGIGYEFFAKIFVAQIAGNCNRSASGFLDQSDDFVRVRLFGGKIIDRDVGAFARIGDRGRATHSGISASDQRLATGQSS